ncbi:MAG: 2-C-methyl-D-erythritol 2,4-cyclodiphosphate synthase [Candidatus Anoxychlamydiales bacterium]|nr:2-C-methyl-D-erythritol 2,4-cyclodiphosphate synthase [Candidatus Anoxychlamydiales bacterium]
MQNYIPRIGIGQDSHRFSDNFNKKCILAGVVFEDLPCFLADSDGDVIFHCICNAISSITHVPILGKVAIELCHKDKVTDSKIYLQKALETLKSIKITHVAITIEAKKPKLQKKINLMRENISKIMNLDIDSVGITVTSGDGLSDFARGEGVQAFCIVSSIQN